jgi:hypothetical protein
MKKMRQVLCEVRGCILSRPEFRGQRLVLMAAEALHAKMITRALQSCEVPQRL